MIQFDKLPPETIRIENRLRPLNESTVQQLVESIQSLGLQTPISVRLADEENPDYAATLVAGAHRLEALKRMGWEFVPVAIHDGTPDEARMWEIAENLHRAELSAVERADHIEEWRRLAAKGAHDAHPSKNAQPHNAGVSATAKELGVSRKTVERAAKIAALPPEVKEQAHAENWSQARTLAAAAPSKPAPAIKNAFESEEDWRRALFSVWNRGAQDWRERALEAIDQPLFDQSAR